MLQCCADQAGGDPLCRAKRFADCLDPTSYVGSQTLAENCWRAAPQVSYTRVCVVAVCISAPDVAVTVTVDVTLWVIKQQTFLPRVQPAKLAASTPGHLTFATLNGCCDDSSRKILRWHDGQCRCEQRHLRRCDGD
jgi:hypothetical protein